jgi:16S rRNA (adenine1518-N6/adenine1519-N6)-dimethyltransferase
MRPKKHLGQHFLRDARALEMIADAARLSPTDTVLEVGPGDGALTALLLERAARVVAVEKDSRLILVLQKKFTTEIASGKLVLCNQDILDFSDYSLLTTHYKLVANIPYYITGAFLKKFLQTDTQPVSMTLLLQNEVAERIVAPNGKESILSISVKCYGTPRMVGVVEAVAFEPPPAVDSAILAIENISKEFFVGVSESTFFSLLKRGFSHPRKLLFRNLEVPVSVLLACGIAPNARAENVSLKEWGRLVLDA